MPYPDELDELAEIVDRTLVGGVWTPGTKWEAATVNPWITAINSIEKTLGINPEGGSDTVAERITAVEYVWVMEFVANGDDMTLNFALDHTPVAGTIKVWLQKELQIPNGLNPDDASYELVGNILTFNTPPPLYHPIYAHYAYVPTP